MLSCVASCFSGPPVVFSPPVIFRSFPHLSISLITPPGPDPLISVSVYIVFVLPHVFVTSFRLHLSSPVMPPCILLQCLLLRPPIGMLWFWFLEFSCDLYFVYAFVATLFFVLGALIWFICISWFWCVFQLRVIKARFSEGGTRGRRLKNTSQIMEVPWSHALPIEVPGVPMSTCLLVCRQDCTKNTEQISTKLGWRMGFGLEHNPGSFVVDLNKGTYPGIVSDYPLKLQDRAKIRWLVSKWDCWALVKVLPLLTVILVV